MHSSDNIRIRCFPAARKEVAGIKGMDPQRPFVTPPFGFALFFLKRSAPPMITISALPRNGDGGMPDRFSSRGRAG